MTLKELSVSYHGSAWALRDRILELEGALVCATPERKRRLEGRIRQLHTIWRQTRDLAILTERYYERGYHRNGKYTV